MHKRVALQMISWVHNFDFESCLLMFGRVDAIRENSQEGKRRDSSLSDVMPTQFGELSHQSEFTSQRYLVGFIRV